MFVELSLGREYDAQEIVAAAASRQPRSIEDALGRIYQNRTPERWTRLPSGKWIPAGQGGSSCAQP